MLDYDENGTKENPEGDVCIICDRNKKAGIRIFSQFICEECEAEMVRTEVEDEKYSLFIHQLKKIWDRQKV